MATTEMGDKEKKYLPPKPKEAEATVLLAKVGHIIAKEVPNSNNHRLPVANPNSPSVTYAEAERRLNAMARGTGIKGTCPSPAPAPAKGGGPGVLNPAAAHFRPAAGGLNLQQCLTRHFPNTPTALVRNPPTGPAPVRDGPGPFPSFGFPVAPFLQTTGLNPFQQNGGYYPYQSYPEYSHTHQIIGQVPLSEDTGHDSDNVPVGPAVPPPTHASPTAWLSYECQKRHFNPVFRVTQLPSGRFKCDVILSGVVVEGGTASFDEIQDAKMHTAAKARKIVQDWKGMDFLHTVSGPVEELHARNEEWEEDKEENGSQMGPGTAVDMTNPEQARAYVEGFRMGQIAALQAANGPSRGRVTAPREHEKKTRRGRSRSRARSRSPKRSHDDRHLRRRSRSSTRRSKSINKKCPPRYHDGSRRDPTLPSTDRYRPDPPVEPKEEDNYGRLREDDISYNG